MKTTMKITLGFAAAAALLVAGCDTLDFADVRTRHHSSSLYAYLYPGVRDHVDTPGMATLSLPLRVGIAFVPPDNGGRQNYVNYSTDDIVISESQKMALMKKISAEFKKYPFVKSIDLIPTTYLTPRGGFANLDQIRAMYDVDVMVLLSYDQVQFTGENFMSVTYWTIVGAYVVNGEQNDTKTMLDAAVFDVASRRLLFRAPGIGDIQNSATPIKLRTDLREDSDAGFDMAATNLTTNLQLALADFKERVTNSPADYKIQYKPGYTGGAAFDGTQTLLLGGLGACLVWTLRNPKKGRV